MILGFLRIFAIGVILMTGIYLLVSAFLWSGLAAVYRKEWAGLPDEDRQGLVKEDWVREKVETHRCGIRMRSFLMSFALLPIGFLTTIILVN